MVTWEGVIVLVLDVLLDVGGQVGHEAALVTWEYAVLVLIHAKVKHALTQMQYRFAVTYEKFSTT